MCIRDRQKDIALLVLDIMMPRINGFEVCREIRQTSKVPIIMLTAKGDERHELNGFDIGADEYISKPFSPKILVARVNALPVSYTHLYALRMRFTNMRVYGFLAWEAQTAINREKISIRRRR